MAIAWWPPPYLKVCALQIGVAIRDSAREGHAAWTVHDLREAFKHAGKAAGLAQLEVAAKVRAGAGVAAASVQEMATEVGVAG
eukprot:CAMPEP_0119398522 /NCGR_PEP_ID=MMETSP1334-20130426/140889_1 /TAXON_ID=127549 /ORGANISM="Calcidiscus leptoporus, Strain RCC1130" /LENGTH=82 /DNA_ID=CAMNT_0007422389 /DNA_START=118 /DNA_END=366 /DNA_ORIENTATION=+